MSKLLFCLAFCIAVLSPCSGEDSYVIDSSRIDSSNIVPRQIDSHFFETFRNEADFDYSEALEIKASSFWQNFITWLIQHLRLSQAHVKLLGILFKVLFWLIIAAILIIAITRLKFYRFFYSSKEAPQKEFTVENSNEEVEDIHSAIQRELLNGNYRLALRYQFIAVLKDLDEKELISFSTEKTNIDYLLEIRKKSGNMSGIFEVLTNTYNAVWYGHFGINKTDYDRYSASFVKLNSMLHAKD